MMKTKIEIRVQCEVCGTDQILEKKMLGTTSRDPSEGDLIICSNCGSLQILETDNKLETADKQTVERIMKSKYGPQVAKIQKIIRMTSSKMNNRLVEM